MYANTWVDLSDASLLSDPFAWGLEHGATAVTNSSDNLNVCLTTDAGTVVPRPGCELAPTTSAPTTGATTPPSSPVSASSAGGAVMSSANGSLPDTGTPGTAYLFTSLVLLLSGVVMLLVARFDLHKPTRRP